MKREPVLRERFRVVMWLYIALSLVLGWGVPRVVAGPLAWVNPILRPDQVIAFLSAVSTGMMAFTGIVFSLLFILMQFGSSAYSPHLVAMLAKNPVIVQAQGVFTGTFLYTLMALRGVGAVRGEGTTALTVWVAFLWLIASIYLLARLVDVFARLAITDVLDMLGDTGRREIGRVYGPYSPSPRPALDPPGRVTQTVAHRGPPRYVLGLDVEKMLSLASGADAVIRVPVAIGDAVSIGTTIATVEGSGRVVPEDGLRGAIVLGSDRTNEAGPKHAMRLLVDIALRALAVAANDPTTAVHSIDQIEDLLLRLGQSNLDVGTVRDASGAVRVVYAAPTWEELLELGVTEIQHYGAGSVQVERRLAALFSALRDGVPAPRRAAVERLALERTATVRGAFTQPPLRERAEQFDRQGLGHTSARA